MQQQAILDLCKIKALFYIPQFNYINQNIQGSVYNQEEGGLRSRIGGLKLRGGGGEFVCTQKEERWVIIGRKKKIRDGSI